MRAVNLGEGAAFLPGGELDTGFAAHRDTSPAYHRYLHPADEKSHLSGLIYDHPAAGNKGTATTDPGQPVLAALTSFGENLFKSSASGLPHAHPRASHPRDAPAGELPPLRHSQTADPGSPPGLSAGHQPLTTAVHKNMVQCAGCERPIMDKFLLNVLDRAWHTKCVACSDCGLSLTDKCFSRDGQLYCRDDFFRWVAPVIADLYIFFKISYVRVTTDRLGWRV